MSNPDIFNLDNRHLSRKIGKVCIVGCGGVVQLGVYAGFSRVSPTKVEARNDGQELSNPPRS